MRQLVLLSVLLLAVSWVAAQSNSSQTTPSTSSSQTSSDPQMGGGSTSVEGCLGGSEGNYTLTDKNGASWQLSGDTAKLKEHVGHEVKITGTEGSSSASSSGQSADNTGQGAGSSKTLQVTSVKHVSKTCQAGGASH
jgi:hypothetical protein